MGFCLLITHVCKLFDSYKPYDVCDVLMANGSRIKVVGMDIMKMKMYDGVVRTIGYIRNVPNLRMNFVLPSRLDILGYVFFYNKQVYRG